MKNGHVTIKDVARAAGVSPSTVSRVVADHPAISDKTKRTVRQYMEQLDYHPNAIARSLVSQRSSTLGIIMSRATDKAFLNPFFPEVIRGIAAAANAHRFNLLLSTSEDRRHEEEECITMLRQRKVDGVIILASYRDDPLIARLAEDGYPFVLIGRSNGQHAIHWVNNDNIAAAYEVVKFLLQQGHRRIACLDGNPRTMVSWDRFEGYRQALATGGLQVNFDLVEHSDFSQDAGYEAAQRLLQRAPAFSALFAVDDVLAVGAMRALTEWGYSIGENMAVVGFNNTVLGTCIEPDLASVDVPIYELGKTAAALLIDAIYGKIDSPQSRILPANFIIRESCLAVPNAAAAADQIDIRGGDTKG